MSDPCTAWEGERMVQKTSARVERRKGLSGLVGLPNGIDEGGTSELLERDEEADERMKAIQNVSSRLRHWVSWSKKGVHSISAPCPPSVPPPTDPFLHTSLPSC